MSEVARVAIEAFSAVACFILLKFMVKPYSFTGEGRYLGLPLGFMFLGISYAISAVAEAMPTFFHAEFSWVQLLVRTFAYMFLVFTYFFSSKEAKSARLVASICYSMLTVALFIIIVILLINPQSVLQAYVDSQIYIRIFNIFCLAYVAIFTLRSQVKKPDPAIIWIPLGFILLAVSQYSLLFWFTDSSVLAMVGSFATRLMGLAIFLFVAFQTFYTKDEVSAK